MISITVAVARNNVIGGQNNLLWHLPADLKRFKELTSGHAVIMGRKTFESIGHPLPNRRNIVVTRDAAYAKEGIETVHSLEAALDMVIGPASASATAGEGRQEVFVIGGGEIFRQALPLAGRIYLTKVDADFEGDVFFPVCQLADGPEWREVFREEGTTDEKNVYPHVFLTLERKR